MVIDSRTFVSGERCKSLSETTWKARRWILMRSLKSHPGRSRICGNARIALYYVDEFREAEKQFREDVRVNPNDTEEAAWAFLSQMRKGGEDDASSSSSLKKAREEFVELAGEQIVVK